MDIVVESNVNINEGAYPIYMFIKGCYFIVDYDYDSGFLIGEPWSEKTFINVQRDCIRGLELTLLYKTFDTFVYLCEYKNQKKLLHVTWVER